MLTEQSPCDESALGMLVDGTLDASGEQAVQMHLDSCVDCRRHLDGMMNTDVAQKDARCCLLDDELDAEVAGIESSDLETRGHQADELSESSITAALDRLAPSDHPTMLGRLGGYEVSGVVGAGAMGVVLKAFDQSLDRPVAIKVLAPHLASSGAARKRFAREAKAAAGVLHPNVMAIHSVSNDESLPYLVMPYLRGASLQKRIDNEGPLPVSDILRIGAQIAAGLAAAHAQGLVHRDIKPANILLEEGVERVAITDFGLARAVDDATMTRTGVIAGTPQYMSPEQSRGELVDQRSDLFSLGSVLYTMCAGRAPFRAETSYGVLRRITDEVPRSIRDINPDIPEWLCQIIAKLMSKHPADRFASAGEVAELLEQCLAHVQQPATVPLPEGGLSLCEKNATNKPGLARATFFRKPRLRAPWVRTPWLVTGAFCFAIIFAGVIIVLELNKGTLSIECEADDVPVRIMQGDKVVETLTVTKDGASVRIAAGTYVVQIDGNPDEISVNKNTVNLHRGGREVVRVVWKTNDDETQVKSVETTTLEGDGRHEADTDDDAARRTHFTVTGPVAKPGEHFGSFGNFDLRLLDALALAGGLTEGASDKVLLMRTTNDGRKLITQISISKAREQAEYNLPIASGDVISVQSATVAQNDLPGTTAPSGLPGARALAEAPLDIPAARALCDKLRQRLKLIEKAYRVGEASLLEVLTNTKDLAEAEVAAAATPEERQKARQRHVDVLKQLKVAAEALYKANEAGKADVLAVEAELIKAETQLKRDTRAPGTSAFEQRQSPRAVSQMGGSVGRLDVKPGPQLHAAVLIRLPHGVIVSAQTARDQPFADNPAKIAMETGTTLRLSLRNLPGYDGTNLLGSIELASVTSRTRSYLEHNAIPLDITSDDVEQAVAGNLITKVIYLPNSDDADRALAGVESLVNTRLDPGVDPITAAQQRGAIVAVLRLGNRDEQPLGIIPRWERWEIRFDTKDIDTYTKQLDFFKIELGAARGGSQHVDYISSLSGAMKTRSSLGIHEQRLYLISTNKTQRKLNEFIRRQAGIDSNKRLMLQFYPKEVEDRLALLEREIAKGKTLAEYLKTVFGIRPKGSGWEFFVEEQRFRPKLPDAQE